MTDIHLLSSAIHQTYKFDVKRAKDFHYRPKPIWSNSGKVDWLNKKVNVKVKVQAGRQLDLRA